MAKKKRHGEELRRARLAAFCELWDLQNSVPGHAAGGEYYLQPEGVEDLAEWLEMPVLAVELLNGGVKVKDLREWEAWPDREMLLKEYQAHCRKMREARLQLKAEQMKADAETQEHVETTHE